MSKLKLTIELIPKTSWYNNVRSHVSKQIWDIIRKKCYELAKHKCEICNSIGGIECHEIWKYDDFKHTQTLIGFVSLCSSCHKVKHPGLAKLRGEGKLVEDQLMNINNWSRNQAIEYLINSFNTWEIRSQYQWTIDISFINNYIKKEPNESTIF
jgi:hypothetical protein